jgi:hypothetical protein
LHKRGTVSLELLEAVQETVGDELLLLFIGVLCSLAAAFGVGKGTLERR